MADAIMAGRSPRIEGVYQSGKPTWSTERFASSTDRGDGAVLTEDDGSGSDIDPEEVQAFLERNAHMEVSTEGPNRHVIISIGYDLLTNSEQAVSSFAPLFAAIVEYF